MNSEGELKLTDNFTGSQEACESYTSRIEDMKFSMEAECVLKKDIINVDKNDIENSLYKFTDALKEAFTPPILEEMQ